MLTSEIIEENGISEVLGADAGALETSTMFPTPDMQVVIDAWPNLSEAMRAGIIAMVAAAERDRRREPRGPKSE